MQQTSDQSPTLRQRRLGLLARSSEAELAKRIATLESAPPFTWLRKPETGMIMIRGRIGGTGAQFNMGEATITRCALRLDDGKVGIGYVKGISNQHAEMIALCDALLQRPEYEQRITDAVIAPLQAYEDSRRTQRAAEVAGSKVDFFTLARGED